MYEYKAPLRDIDFVYRELFQFEEHLSSFPQFQEISWDLWSAVVQENAKFSENTLAPMHQSADDEGCHWMDGEVTTPKGFKEAYQQYAEAGWQGMSAEERFGGQGLPPSITTCTYEFRGSANWAWTSMTGFGLMGARTLINEGSEELQQTYLPKIYSGEWLGTMCLTEAHCGTDLGMMRTKALPQADGTYQITGTKIFITAGDHDMAENIVHIVLAKIDGAPEGTAGISAFVVPKFLVNGDVLGEPNGVYCGSIEKKMGIKGSATCVMNFENARGYLIGEPNKGMKAMFHMMNSARVGTGLQGLCHAELGLQKSVGYAKERLQMRALTGAANPDGPADPIIVHPDVRRMLLTQKALAEGGRMLIGYCAKLMDVVDCHPDREKASAAEEELGYLTPIVKGFLTETGFESASLAVQCFGGHGYIKEWGVEQNLRDSRIAMLYEGTTGIQALDLLGRKVLVSRGEAMGPMMAKIQNFCENNSGSPFARALGDASERLVKLTQSTGMAAMEEPNRVGSASVDYLMYSGYVVLGYFWAEAAAVAQENIEKGNDSSGFYDAKLKTAQFYFDRLLPRTDSLAAGISAKSDSLMSMDAEQFLSHI